MNTLKLGAFTIAGLALAGQSGYYAVTGQSGEIVPFLLDTVRNFGGVIGVCLALGVAATLCVAILAVARSIEAKRSDDRQVRGAIAEQPAVNTVATDGGGGRFNVWNYLYYAAALGAFFYWFSTFHFHDVHNITVWDGFLFALGVILVSTRVGRRVLSDMS